MMPVVKEPVSGVNNHLEIFPMEVKTLQKFVEMLIKSIFVSFIMEYNSIIMEKKC